MPAGAFGLIPRGETADVEFGLHAAVIHLIAEGLLHPGGQAPAFAQFDLAGSGEMDLQDCPFLAARD
ncbi:hypothetical protein SAMN05216289_1377 [Dokdonella immobilis]|uniref:Uncharacterized protein n=1 Tax=Dokdonella immobilis TaxID=578942 RepID=A0A1I5AFJ1_9GAMM|nr:hypothetical protein SAMN05216289_1377 [Dokdonella immobilis]